MVLKTEPLENFLKQNRLSKEEFCKLANISSRKLAKFLTDDLTLGLGEFIRIANTIKLSPRELLQ